MANRVAAVVAFQSAEGQEYVYDDNTGTILAANSATLPLIEQHQSVDLQTAALELGERYSARNIADSVDLITHWEDAFGAFYRPAECPSKVAAAMRNCSEPQVHAAIVENGFRQLVLTLTENCNLRCRYCYYSDPYPVTRNRTTRFMTFETGRRAIDYFFAQAHRGVSRNPTRMLGIGFYGGEPLLRFETLRSLVTYANAGSECPLMFSVTTNGTLLTSEHSDFLVGNRFRILVSLDGPRAVHDRNRVFADNRGTFDSVVSNLKAFRDRHGDYDGIHLSSVCDWGTDLLAVCEFFETNDSWLPRPGTYSGVTSQDTSYFDQFSETDRQRFGRSHAQLWASFVEKAQRGERTSDALRMIVEQQLGSVLHRRRQRDPVLPWLPFTRSCVPGTKILVRADGTFDICERVNGTMPIGDVDRGLDFGRVAELINMYNVAVCAQCWTCPITKLCTECFATCNGPEGSFKKLRSECAAAIDKAKERLSVICTISEHRPGALNKPVQSQDIRFITS
jgi:uncharacterized protein